MKPAPIVPIQPEKPRTQSQKAGISSGVAVSPRRFSTVPLLKATVYISLALFIYVVLGRDTAQSALFVAFILKVLTLLIKHL